MKTDPFPLGSRVVVNSPVEQGAVVTIIEGPVFKNGKTIYKVDHGDFENWYPVDALKPLLRLA
jgi:hypothetical protein